MRDAVRSNAALSDKMNVEVQTSKRTNHVSSGRLGRMTSGSAEHVLPASSNVNAWRLGFWPFGGLIARRFPMAKTRKNKRKAPVTSSVRPSDRSSQPSGSSYRPQATRTVIRRFHVLLKRQGQLRQVIQDATPHAKTGFLSAQNELSSVEEEIEALGGLAAYQRMSTIGQGKDRGGGSEKVLIAWMRELDLHDEAKTSKTPLR